MKITTRSGEEIFVHVLENQTNGRLKLGFVAPRDVQIWRTELLPRPAAGETTSP